jgi:hypothetical protein
MSTHVPPGLVSTEVQVTKQIDAILRTLLATSTDAGAGASAGANASAVVVVIIVAVAVLVLVPCLLPVHLFLHLLEQL